MRFAKVLAALVFLQVIFGALVAGIDGGLSYNDWPLMGGEFFSSDSFVLSPWWRNFFENSVLVQFLHRMNGYLLFALAVWLFLRTRRAAYKQWKMLGMHVMIAVFLQVILGIVVLVRFVPIPEALTHQLFAIAIWVAVFSAIFAFRFPRPQSVKAR